jgi:hypothetical protein
MVEEFIYNHFFLIAKLIILIGVGLFIYAGFVKSERHKKINIDEIKGSTGIRENNVLNYKEKISKNNGILKGVGVTVIIVGSILFIIGVAAIIFVIYFLILLKDFFRGLGG